MQEKKQPGDENDMHSVVMSYDDLWPGHEARKGDDGCCREWARTQ